MPYFLRIASFEIRAVLPYGTPRYKMYIRRVAKNLKIDGYYVTCLTKIIIERMAGFSSPTRILRVRLVMHI